VLRILAPDAQRHAVDRRVFGLKGEPRSERKLEKGFLSMTDRYPKDEHCYGGQKLHGLHNNLLRLATIVLLGYLSSNLFAKERTFQASFDDNDLQKNRLRIMTCAWK
jgi:hypothetical protein